MDPNLPPQTPPPYAGQLPPGGLYPTLQGFEGLPPQVPPNMHPGSPQPGQFIASPQAPQYAPVSPGPVPIVTPGPVMVAPAYAPIVQTNFVPVPAHLIVNVWRVLDTVGVRKSPNPKLDSLTTLKPGHLLVEAGRSGDWIMYRKDKMELWVLTVFHGTKRVVEPVLQGTFWRVLHIVNIRKKPDVHGSQVDTLKEGTIVEEVERNGLWVRSARGWSCTIDTQQQRPTMEQLTLASLIPQVVVQPGFMPGYGAPPQGFPQGQPMGYMAPQGYPQGYQPPPQGYQPPPQGYQPPPGQVPYGGPPPY